MAQVPADPAREAIGGLRVPPHRVSVSRLARWVTRSLALGVIALGMIALFVWPGGPSVLALFWILIVFAPVAIWPVPLGSIVGGVIALVAILLLCLPAFLPQSSSLAEWLTILTISAGGLVFAALISGYIFVFVPVHRLFAKRPDLQLNLEQHLEDKSRTVQRNKRAIIIAGFVQWVLMLIVLGGIGIYATYLTSTLESGAQASAFAKWFVLGTLGLLAGPIKLGGGILLPSLCASMALIGLANRGLPYAGETRLGFYVWRAAVTYACFLIVMLPALPLLVTRNDIWLTHPSLASAILLGSALTGLIAGLAGGITYWLVLRPGKQTAVLAVHETVPAA